MLTLQIITILIKFISDILLSHIGKQSEMDHISELWGETRAKSILDAKDRLNNPTLPGLDVFIN